MNISSVAQSSIVWVIAQQVLVRGMAAIKFFVAAKMIGPEMMGLFGIAMLTLAISESLSDTGIVQIVIQKKNNGSAKQNTSILLINTTRGVLLCLAIALLATPLSVYLDEPRCRDLIFIIALLPILKGLQNPSVIYSVRKRNFRKQFFLEVAVGVVDLLATIILLRKNYLVKSILLAMLISEIFRLILLWRYYEKNIARTTRLSHILRMTAKGRWIWRGNIVTLVLNQVDKLLVVKYLGTGELGFYQLAAKVTQIIIYDPYVAITAYLFPNFSKKYRESNVDLDKYFGRIIKPLLLYLAVMGSLIIAFSAYAVNKYIGNDWAESSRYIVAMIFPMSIGSLIIVYATYFRATDRQRELTFAIFCQLASYILLLPLGAKLYGGVGIVCAIGLSGCTCLFVLMKMIYRKNYRSHDE